MGKTKTVEGWIYQSKLAMSEIYSIHDVLIQLGKLAETPLASGTAYANNLLDLLQSLTNSLVNTKESNFVAHNKLFNIKNKIRILLGQIFTLYERLAEPNCKKAFIDLLEMLDSTISQFNSLQSEILSSDFKKTNKLGFKSLVEKEHLNHGKKPARIDSFISTASLSYYFEFCEQSFHQNQKASYSTLDNNFNPPCGLQNFNTDENKKNSNYRDGWIHIEGMKQISSVELNSNQSYLKPMIDLTPPRSENFNSQLRTLTPKAFVPNGTETDIPNAASASTISSIKSSLLSSETIISNLTNNSGTVSFSYTNCSYSTSGNCTDAEDNSANSLIQPDNILYFGTKTPKLKTHKKLQNSLHECSEVTQLGGIKFLRIKKKWITVLNSKREIVGSFDPVNFKLIEKIMTRSQKAQLSQLFAKKLEDQSETINSFLESQIGLSEYALIHNDMIYVYEREKHINIALKIIKGSFRIYLKTLSSEYLVKKSKVLH